MRYFERRGGKRRYDVTELGQWRFSFHLSSILADMAVAYGIRQPLRPAPTDIVRAGWASASPHVQARKSPALAKLGERGPMAS